MLWAEAAFYWCLYGDGASRIVVVVVVLLLILQLQHFVSPKSNCCFSQKEPSFDWGFITLGLTHISQKKNVENWSSWGFDQEKQCDGCCMLMKIEMAFNRISYHQETIGRCLSEPDAHISIDGNFWRLVLAKFPRSNLYQFVQFLQLKYSSN